MLMMRKSAIFLLFIFSASHALAAESIGISIGDSSIMPGTVVSLPITVEGANEIAGGYLNLSFNPEFISVQSVASGDFGAPTYNMGGNFVSISLAATNAVGKSKATFAVVVIKGVRTGSTPLRIEDAYLNKEDGSIVVPSIKDGMIIVEGEAGAAAATAEQVKPTEPVKPAATPTIALQPEIQNNSEALSTPLKQDEQQQEKAVKTPALSWIFVVGIIVAVAVIRRRV